MDVIKKEEQIFDVRLAEYHIQHGVTNRKEYERYLKSLPDLSDQYDTISFEDILTPRPKKIRRTENLSSDMEELESLGSDNMVDFNEDDLDDEE